MKFNILIIDDEKNIREGLGAALEMDGYTVFLAADGKQGLEILERGDIDLVITDLKMPEVSGEEILAKVTVETPGIPVIVLTGHGTIDSAVDAMRKGAYDFLTKPVNLDRLSLLVKRALERREISLQNSVYRKEIEGKTTFENMIGKSHERGRTIVILTGQDHSPGYIRILGLHAFFQIVCFVLILLVFIQTGPVEGPEIKLLC